MRVRANEGKELIGAERHNEIITARKAGERVGDIAKRLGVSHCTVVYHEKQALAAYKKPLPDECDAYVEVELIELAPRRLKNRERHDKLHAQFLHISEELEAIQEFDRENRAFANTDTSKLEARLTYLSDALIKLDDQNLRHSNRLAFLVGFDAIKQARGNTSDCLIAFQRGAEEILATMPNELEVEGLDVALTMPIVVKALHGLLQRIQSAAEGSG